MSNDGNRKIFDEIKEDVFQEWSKKFNLNGTEKGYEAFCFAWNSAMKLKNEREKLMIKALEEILKDLTPYLSNDEL